MQCGLLQSLAPFWSSSVGGRPTFAESHIRSFVDDTGEGRTPAATIQWPLSFDHDRTTQRPLILFLASRNGTVTTLQSNWGMADLATYANAFVLRVSGVPGTYGSNSWNGNLCCCWVAADGPYPNDSDYLYDLIQRVIADGWPIDQSRIYGIAQSAGGGMLMRSACDHASTYAAIFDFSGTMSPSVEGGEAPCTPSEPVAFAHAHGTADSSAEPYTGVGGLNSGMANHCISAIDSGGTIDKLKAFNGCAGSLSVTTAGWADLDSAVSGSETDLMEVSGCPAGGAVQHWRMNGTSHTITPTADWQTKVWEFLEAHPKP